MHLIRSLWKWKPEHSFLWWGHCLESIPCSMVLRLCLVDVRLGHTLMLDLIFRLETVTECLIQRDERLPIRVECLLFSVNSFYRLSFLQISMQSFKETKMLSALSMVSPGSIFQTTSDSSGWFSFSYLIEICKQFIFKASCSLLKRLLPHTLTAHILWWRGLFGTREVIYISCFLSAQT